MKCSYCFELSDPRQTKASNKSPLKLCQIPYFKYGRESAWLCWKGQSPKGCPAADDRGCKGWKSACTDTVKGLRVVLLQSGKNNHWLRLPVGAGQVWHYCWISQGRRWISQGRRRITIRERRSRISVSKMFEGILKINPPSTYLGSLTVACHKDDECHAWGGSRPHRHKGNTKETFTSAPNWRGAMFWKQWNVYISNILPNYHIMAIACTDIPKDGRSWWGTCLFSVSAQFLHSWAGSSPAPPWSCGWKDWNHHNILLLFHPVAED